MALPTIIAVNQTASDITLTSLGSIVVPGSGQVTLSDYYTVQEIQKSSELYNEINTGDIFINDGTTTLTQTQSLNVMTPVASPDNPNTSLDEFNDYSSVTEKTTPVDADLLLIEDSQASNVKKKVQIGNLGSSGHTIQDEGSSLTARTNLNFIGNGVVASDNAGSDSTDVTINGPTDLATVQARRTTAYTLTTGFVSLTFDATDVETDATVVEHNNTTTSRIDIKEDGAYLITYRGIIDNGGTTGAAFSSRLYKNGTTLISGSSETQTQDQASQGDVPVALGRSVVVSLVTNDYVEVQYMASSISDAQTVSAGSILNVTKLEGAVGATGAAGADGDITWEGAWVTSTAYTTNQAVENDGSSYVCILNHTSSASDEPGVGGSWATYWDVMASKGDVGAAGNGPEIITTASHNGPDVSNASSTYATYGRIAFRGSTVAGTPTSIKSVARVGGGTGGKVRIYDATNAATIAEITTISNTTNAVVDLGTISNVPTGEAVWEVQIGSDNVNALYHSSVRIDY